MNGQHDTSGLSNRASNYIRIYGRLLCQLPPPDEEWQARDDHIPDELTRRGLYRFRSCGILEKTDERPVEYASDETIGVWRITNRAWRALHNKGYLDDGDPAIDCGTNDALPCGGGFVNKGNGYQCKVCNHFYLPNMVDS